MIPKGTSTKRHSTFSCSRKPKKNLNIPKKETISKRKVRHPKRTGTKGNCEFLKQNPRKEVLKDFGQWFPKSNPMNLKNRSTERHSTMICKIKSNNSQKNKYQKAFVIYFEKRTQRYPENNNQKALANDFQKTTQTFLKEQVPKVIR